MNAILSNLDSIPDEVRQKAHKVCGEHLRGAWASIGPKDLSVKPIGGGMSNQIFCCSLPESISTIDSEPNQVLLRLYGDQYRNCDMSNQIEIFSLLSQKDLGPKLFGDFEDGRLEEFLPATSLTCEELADRQISSIIARKLAVVHSLDAPIDKENTWFFDRLEEWLTFIRENSETFDFGPNIQESTVGLARQLLTVDFNEEINFLRNVLNDTRSPVVFSHNDLHQGNILLARHSKRRPTLQDQVVLIDFEYCSYNHRAYDIANHFCEWCFEYDTPEYPHFKLFEDRFPTQDMRLDFLRHYSKQFKSISYQHNNNNNNNNNHNHSNNHNNHNASQFTTNGLSHLNGHNHLSNDSTATNGLSTNGNYTNKNQFQKANGHSYGYIETDSSSMNSLAADEEDLLDEVEPFFMAANLLWTIWCIKSAHTSSIKFGYWEHAMSRWKLYLKFKQSFSKSSTNQAEL